MTETSELKSAAKTGSREARRAAWWQRNNPQKETTANEEGVQVKTIKNAPTLIDVPSQKALKKRKSTEASDGGEPLQQVKRMKRELDTDMETDNPKKAKVSKKKQRKVAKGLQQQNKTSDKPSPEIAEAMDSTMADEDSEGFDRLCAMDEDVFDSSAKEDKSNTEKSSEKKKKTEKKRKAYVLFLGQLPYDVTDQDIRAHFGGCGNIDAVRLLTKQGSNEPKGIGYIEFSDRNAHKQALMLHHSKLKGRQINVEFTSRGRKNERRTEYIKQKNVEMAKMKVPLFGVNERAPVNLS